MSPTSAPAGAEHEAEHRNGAGAPPCVRLATEGEARVAAALHAEGIPTGFLSLLGPRFLAHLYRRIVADTGSFLLVCERRGRVVGFLAGSTDVASLYRSFLLHDGVAAALPVAGRLVTNWRRARETLAHGSSGRATKGRGAELLAIAVDPSERSRGTGTALVAAFLDEVTALGGTSAYVVVGEDNGAAVALYDRAHFTERDRFELHPGTTSLLLQWDRAPVGGR